MILSVREVIELAERCFVAAGIDEGAARANATAIWWAEAYHGTGIATLHDLLGPLDDLDTTTPELERRDSPISVLSGAGRPCLVSGIPALDLACAHADRYGTGITYVRESDVSVDGDALGALPYRGADRGYVTFALSVDSDGGSRTVISTPRQLRPALAETTLSAPSKAYAAVEHAVSTGRQAAREAPLFRAFFDEPRATEPFGTVDAKLLYRLACRSVEPEPNAETGPGFIVACIDPRHPRYSGEVGQVVDRTLREEARLFDRRFPPEESQDRVCRLVDEGVEIERDVWRDIFEFSNGILAPPFEGSEKGAGFDLNDLDA